jgi:hypothetical protein
MELSTLRGQLADANERIDILKDALHGQEEKLKVLQRERDGLAQWKREQLVVASWWLEVDTFVRRMPQCASGKHVSHECLRMLEDYERLSKLHS